MKRGVDKEEKKMQTLIGRIVQLQSPSLFIYTVLLMKPISGQLAGLEIPMVRGL